MPKSKILTSKTPSSNASNFKTSKSKMPNKFYQIWEFPEPVEGCKKIHHLHTFNMVVEEKGVVVVEVAEINKFTRSACK